MQNSKQIRLCVVVPCYNEEEVILDTYSKLSAKLAELISNNLITNDSKMLFIDDGSKDKTWQMISQLSTEKNDCFALKLSKNYGHQNALIAGMEHIYTISQNAKSLGIVPFEAIISIDADLQDDINVFSEMIEKFNAGNEIVFGVRDSRDSDTIFKRMTAEGFYKVMERLGVKLVFNHADFRLVSMRVLGEFLRYKENRPFLRGIFANMGFKSDKVYYDRSARLAGESKYPLKKMIAFAWNGVTSYSDSVLKIPIYLGFMTLLSSVVLLAYILYSYFSGIAVSGWASLSVVVLFFSSVNMFILAVLAEYVGKIYMELKGRPRYHIDKVNDDTKSTKH